MASINQIVSEIAHVAQSPNNIALLRGIRGEVIHARSELIRKGFNNRGFVDKSLQQRYSISLINVPDGDNNTSFNDQLKNIKRSKTLIPKPVRYTNGIPFLSVRSVGSDNPIVINYAPEYIIKFNSYLPGANANATYDYINGYLYIYYNNPNFANISNVIIETTFEDAIVEVKTSDGSRRYDDDNECMIPEDLIGPIKELVATRLSLQIHRETNEVTEQNKYK